MLDLLHHAARDDLRVVEHLLEVVHAGARHAGDQQRLLELLRLARPHRRLDQRQQRVLVALAARIGGEARIAQVRVEPQHLHQLAEQRVVRRADREIALVLGLEQLIGRAQPVPVAERLRHLAGLEIFGRLPGRRRDRRLDQRDVGNPPLALARRAHQPRQGRIGGEQRAEHVGGLQARSHRHLARLAGHRQRARERLDDQIDAGAAPIRPGLAEARHRGVDDARIGRLHLRGAEPELVERARPVRLQEHVGLRRQLEQDLDRFRPLEVEHQAALVAVERDEAHALVVADRRRGAAHVALRRLDLDDVGAHVGEQRAGQRPGDEVRQLDDANPGERFCHLGSLRFPFPPDY